MKEKIFIVPVSWEVQGTLEIEAKNPREAKSIANKHVHRKCAATPSFEYIDNSIKVHTPRTFRNTLVIDGKQSFTKKWGEIKEHRV